MWLSLKVLCDIILQGLIISVELHNNNNEFEKGGSLSAIKIEETRDTITNVTDVYEVLSLLD